MLALVFAFLLGSFVGSFLNVCIHRLPRNESVVLPPSRCYSCGTHVQWYDNLPLVSWLVLRGRCRWCDAPFSARYLAIEALVGLLTASIVWLVFDPVPAWSLHRAIPWWAPWTIGAGLDQHVALALAAGALLALVYFLVVSVFTDLDHMIIPDELTKSFQVAAPFLGALCVNNLAIGWTSVLWLLGHGPDGQKQYTPHHFVACFLGVVLGSLVLLALTLPLARVIYTRFVPKAARWDEKDHRGFALGVVWFIASMVPASVAVTLLVMLGTGGWPWMLAVGLAQAVLGGLAGWMSLYLVGLIGTVVFRRNAMGFGDVKFLAPIGCFLGPIGVAYAFFAAAVIGSLVGIPMRLVSARREIPFGPYLAVGALLVLIWGPQLHAFIFG